MTLVAIGVFLNSLHFGDMHLGSEQNFVCDGSCAGCRVFLNFDLTPNAVLLDRDLMSNVTINYIAG